MTLEQLLTATKVLSIQGGIDSIVALSITALCYDSRKVAPGNLFFALKGQKTKGSSFIENAITNGAVAIVTEEEIQGLSVPCIRVANTRIAMGDMAAAFYRFPSHTLATCAVTGTNGKTTTTYLVRHLCDASGRRSGLIGTVNYVLPGLVEEATHTTPESVELQSMMQRMRDGGFKAVALEASSHAIVQDRLQGIEFDVAIFTNLSQDHLDYHGSMDAYFEAKTLLFKKLVLQNVKKARAVINADDRYGRLLLDRIPSNLAVITFGQASNVDFRARDIRYSAIGTQFCLEARGKSYLVRSPLIGLFNVYNVLGALASATTMGLELRRAVKAMETAPQIPGRLERVPGRQNFQVFVDYAHTPDALENVLRSLRQLEPTRLIVVFGCGGDRDRSKRPLMAAAAERYADVVIVTTDNPRNEDPLSIIADVKRGFQHSHYQAICDREAAIAEAIQQANPHDIVLIAGKGHETYQEVRGVRSSFDDVIMAQRAIGKKFQEF